MSLRIYLGPMYAGKTTHLINLYRYHGGIILDYSEDKTNQKGTFKSHNNIEIACYKVNQLMSFMDDILENETNIYINEAQFFDDLYDFVLKYENKKNICVFGLDGDFERKPFGEILKIIPLCDFVTKLKGYCKKCNKDSIFSKRIVSNKEQYLLDETAYIPTCRNCFTN